MRRIPLSCLCIAVSFMAILFGLPAALGAASVRWWKRSAFVTVLVVLLMAGFATIGVLAQTAHFLGSTTTLGHGFLGPSGVAVDSAGNIYVADTGNGAVKKIPYSGGSYGTPVTLASGFFFPSGVAVDSAGNVYVADEVRNVVKKIPCSGGIYGTPVILGSGFSAPYGVAVDGVGNVYVADAFHNAVKKIPYSGGIYGTPVTLNSEFAAPYGVTVDGAGNVYVADASNNTVEKIPYSGGTYGTPAPLGSGFSNPTGVAVDGAGNVYVGDNGNHAVKEIPYSGGSYGTPVTLGSGLSQPYGVAVDGLGNVYVADWGNTAIEKIELSVDFGAVNIGTSASSQTIAFSIDSAGTLGIPTVLTQGATGQDFTDAGTGTCSTNVSAGDTCTVVVNFSPKSPGTRNGAVILVSSTGTALATAYLQGTGNGAQVTFPPGPAPVALGSGFNSPSGVTVDGAGNVYVVDADNNAIKKVPYSGGSYGTPVTLGSGFNSPGGVTVDGAGNVYVADAGNNAIKKFPYSGGSYGTPVTLGSGFIYPSGVAVDGAGNVYVADAGNNAIKQVPYSGGSYGTPVTLGSGFSDPGGVAVDSAGNVYVADTDNHVVKKIPYSGGAYGTPVIVASVTGVDAITLDGSGNIFVVDSGRSTVSEIPYSGGSYGTPVTLGSGFRNPSGVAVDGAGNVYVADTSHNAVKKVDLADPPSLTFVDTAVGSTSATQTVTVANTGNQSLTLPIPGSGSNPSLSIGFARDSSSTCPQLTSSSLTPGTLPAGTSCTEVLAFAPEMGASYTGSLTLTDNAGNPSSTITQSISLNGTGITGTTPQTITFPQPVTPASAGSTVTLTASSDSGLPITYSVISGPATVSGSSLTYTGPGTVVIEADQYGSATYAAATPVQVTIAVTVQQNVGVSSGVLMATVTVQTAGTLSSISVLTQGAPNLDFQEAAPDNGTCYARIGQPLSVGDTCTVQYTFLPTSPGTRTGAVVLADGSGTALAMAYLQGTGNGAQVTFPPGLAPVTLGSGFNYPVGAAVDGAGNLYVADTNNNAVKKIPYSGGSYGTPVTLGSGFNQPYGVAVDGAGNLYVADTNNNAVKKIPYSGGSYGAPVTLGSGFSQPIGVAVDGVGDVYVVDRAHQAIKKISYSGGSYGTPVTLGSGFSSPDGVTVDGMGNVYVADTGHNALKKIPFSGGSYGTPVTLADGFNILSGVAVDGAGNVYVADYGNSLVEKFPYIGGSYGTPVALGSGFNGSSALAVDGAGNIYVTNTDGSTVEKVDLSDAPSLTFADTAVGNTSATQTATVANTGNQPLTLPVSGSGSNPSLSTGFVRDNSSTCPQLTSSSSTPGTLNAGASCTELLAFAPETASGYTGSLTLTDNAGNPSSTVTQSIALSGTGIQGTPTITTIPTASGITYGQTLASSTLSGGVASTAGTFTWTNSTTAPSAGTASYSVTFTPTDTANYTTVTTTVSVITSKATPTITTLPTASAIAYGQTLASSTLTGGAAIYNGNTVAGSFGWTSSATVPISGTPDESVTFTPTDTVNYSTATGTVALTVNTPNYVVNTASDDAGTAANCSVQSSSTSNTTDSACSLRDALLAAAAAGSANITFSSTGFASTQTIALTNGTLTIPTHTTITGATSGSGMSLTNLVTVNGGSANNFSIFTAGSGVTSSSIHNLIIMNGHVNTQGGGLNNAGTLTVADCTFTNNYAGGYVAGSGNGGGAIYNSSGALTITRSAFSGNTSSPGGAISLGGGTLSIANSTFFGNTAQSTYAGGAIFVNTGATLTVSNSTFSGNTAAGGGAIMNYGTLTMTNSIIANNSGGGLNNSGTSTVSNSLIGANSGADCTGTCPTNGVNGNHVGASGVVLTALGNYGGPTQTILPTPSSPAICLGSANNAANANITSDQRGVAMSLTSSNANSYTGVGGYCAAGSIDAGAVQTSYAMSFSTQPSNVVQDVTMSPAPAVTLTENGSAFTASAVTIPLTLTSTPTGATLSGDSATTIAGVATYNSLSVNSAGTGTTLTATLPIPLRVTSNSFTVSTSLTATQAIAAETLTYGTAASFMPVTGSGGTAPLTYSVSPALPAGLSLSASTGAITGTPTATQAVSSYTITVTDTNGSSATAGFSIVVNKATPSIATLPTASEITYGQTLASSVLSGGAATFNGNTIAGTFAWTTSATSPSAGTSTEPVTFTPNDIANYNTATGTVAVTVNKATVTVTWATPSSIVYGTALSAVQLNATASVPGSFTYSPVAGTVLTAGSHTLSASFTPTDTSNYATPAASTINLSVTVSPLMIAVNNATRVYGGANPTLIGTPSGLVNGDTAAAIGLAYSTTATQNSAVGNYPITATITSTDYTLTVTPGVLAVTGASLTVTANNATKIYGTANPSFSGSVTGAQNSDSFTATYSTTATVSSNAGTYAIVPSVMGTNLADYAVTKTNGTLTVSQAASSVALTSSATSIVPGQSVTLTVTTADVTPNSIGTPTGMVSFYNGTALLGTSSLTNGIATFTTNSLVAGATYSISASYGGDTNFTASATGSGISVTVAALDFTLTPPANTNLTVMPGGSVQSSFSITPLYGSSAGQISFTVTGLPTGATISFSPANITASTSSAQTITMTIKLPAATAQNQQRRPDRSIPPIALGVLLLPLAVMRRVRKSALLRSTLLLLLSIAGIGALTGCGAWSGFNATALQNYTVTVTATVGSLTHSFQINLNVQ